jgi:hypothetical protein
MFESVIGVRPVESNKVDRQLVVAVGVKYEVVV